MSEVSPWPLVSLGNFSNVEVSISSDLAVPGLVPQYHLPHLIPSSPLASLCRAHVIKFTARRLRPSSHVCTVSEGGDNELATRAGRVRIRNRNSAVRIERDSKRGEEGRRGKGEVRERTGEARKIKGEVRRGKGEVRRRILVSFLTCHGRFTRHCK